MIKVQLYKQPIHRHCILGFCSYLIAGIGSCAHAIFRRWPCIWYKDRRNI